MPHPPLALALAILASAAPDDGPQPEPAKTAPPVSFARQVLPALQRKCQGCHQPAKANGKLLLTSHEGLVKGGDGGASIVPGKPEESLLLEQVEGDKPLMPPTGERLTKDEVDTLRRWIAEGAKDDTPAQSVDAIDAEHPPVYAVPPVTTALAFSPDGLHLAVSGYHEALIHKADGSGLEQRLIGQAQRIESLAYSPDGKVLAAVGGSPGRFGEVQFWDAAAGKLKGAVRSSYDTQYGGAFSPDSKRFAFGCADNSGRVVEVETGKESLKIDHHQDWVFSTAFTLDGKHLVTLGRDGAIKQTESGTGAFIDDIGKNYGELKVMARVPGKDEVIIGGDERVPRLYQIYRTKTRDPQYTDFNLLRAFEAQPGPITALAIAPDGASVAVGCPGNEVRVYNVADGAKKLTLAGHQGSVFAIAFSPDGRRIATGGFDGTIRLFDAASGQAVTNFVPVPLQPKAVALGQ
jgi:WD40 repeat protein/mono/diheme cytochrome c family protein